MLKSILRACLTQKQREAGLYLFEPDDHTVELLDKEGEVLAVWGSSGVTVIEIRMEADKHIGIKEERNRAGGKMKTQKINQIERWYKEGKIKKLSDNCFSVPSEAFIMGITVSLVAEVLKGK